MKESQNPEKSMKKREGYKSLTKKVESTEIIFLRKKIQELENTVLAFTNSRDDSDSSAQHKLTIDPQNQISNLSLNSNANLVSRNGLVLEGNKDKPNLRIRKKK